MHPAVSPRDPELATLLAAIRAERFSTGIRCPRCGGTRVYRWGTFRERQRHRCLGCRRTFSDLTGSPAAYSKKLELWPANGAAMAQSLSVRRTARALGVHPTTAFRWRHRTLAGVRRGDPTRLRGIVEIEHHWSPLSRKGQPGRPQVADGRRAGTPGVVVIVACDREGGVVSHVGDVVGSGQLRLAELEAALAARLAPRPTLVAREGRLGAVARLARRLGGEHVRTCSARSELSRGLGHVGTVRRYRVGVGLWLRPFRGVATRYLGNYLAWHNAVDRRRRMGFEAVSLRWAVAGWPEKHPHFSRTLDQGPAP